LAVSCVLRGWRQSRTSVSVTSKVAYVKWRPMWRMRMAINETMMHGETAQRKHSAPFVYSSEALPNTRSIRRLTVEIVYDNKRRIDLLYPRSSPKSRAFLRQPSSHAARPRLWKSANRSIPLASENSVDTTQR
jgi:hypothetical protein